MIRLVVALRSTINYNVQTVTVYCNTKPCSVWTTFGLVSNSILSTCVYIYLCLSVYIYIDTLICMYIMCYNGYNVLFGNPVEYILIGKIFFKKVLVTFQLFTNLLHTILKKSVKLYVLWLVKQWKVQ